MIRPVIYIIDDEKDVLSVLEGLLESDFDCEVKTFTCLEKALKALEREKILPSVILCDVRLPDINGLRLPGILETLHKKIPVIHITGLEGDDISDEEQTVLSKPIDSKRLRMAVAKYLK